MSTTRRTHVVSIENLRMHCEVVGEGPPLVLLHGFTGVGADWAHVFDLEALAREYQLILPDLRGHGRSDNPSGTFSTGQCATDVLALVDALGIDRFRAMGMSLGANTLLHVGTRAPERVERMVLVSSTPYYPESARRIMAALTEESRTEAEWAELRAKHVRGDDQIRELWRHGRGFAGRFDDMGFTPPWLAQVKAPTLLVQGDRDPLYPVELTLELYRALPDARLWVVPDAGHVPIFLKHREAFARMSREFLGAA
ncbi:alpha/beta hydrolase [Myxococcus stipitatus]|uniref:alpha/beta fold hydrolase n=1 Tax=Myxococcus stipitatus TaxID=83455 RepID=UPI001F254571|nr:alpha/beta fold hydrolase [Myxococcus stipitatus]MCE9670644.1 alpha/beta hydrolase [Myxococcus stipitatus]